MSFLVAIPAGVVLVSLAPSVEARIAATIYALTLIAVFGVSSTYHRGSWSSDERATWQRLDHAAIYLLIAGTYTPYCTLALEDAWRLWMLVAVWVGAFLGILLKLFRIDFHVVSGAMYLALGWAAIVAFPQFQRALSPEELMLTVVGGLLYTGGALVLATNRPRLFPETFGYHELWHAATTVAAGCHYVAILLILLRSSA